MFNLRWYFIGALAFLFAVIGLVYALRSKNQKAQIMMFCSLSFGVLTVLEEIGVIWSWYQWERGIFEAQTPAIISTLNIFWWVLFGVNLISLLVSVKKNKKEHKETT